MSRPLTIGVLSPCLEGFYYGRLLYELYRVTQQIGAQLIAIETPTDNSYNYPLAAEHVDCWVVIKHEMSEPYRRSIQALNKQVVGIGHTSTHYPTVMFANQQSMYKCVEYLIRNGHRQIAFISHINNASHHQRFLGYQQALVDHGMSLNPKLILNIDSYVHRGGHHVAQQLLEQEISCTAIVSCMDLTAVGVMDKLLASGIRVPEDIAIIGHDNTPFASMTTPTLTSVNQPLDLIAESAIATLLQLKEGLEVNVTHYIDAELVIRQSCGGNVSNHDAQQLTIKQQIDNNLKVIHHYKQLTDSNRNFNVNLIKATPAEIKTLTWLESTPVEWGCLGLWTKTTNTSCPKLVIEQMFHKKIKDASVWKQTCSIESFPPFQDLLQLEAFASHDFISLYPVHSGNKEWGVLAMGSKMDQTRVTYRDDTLRHSLDMLATILEREALYDTIRENELNYRLIAENMTDIIYLVNLQGNIQYISPSSTMVLGYAPEHFMGRPFLDTLPSSDREEIDYKLTQMLVNHEPTVLEYKLLHENEQPIIFEAKCTPVFDGEGEVQHILIVARDITYRKTTEELLRKSDKLSVAGQLAAGVAHEIRNPLTSIKGLLQFIKSQTDRHHDYMDIMLSELDRINSILCEMMLIAKPQAAQFQQNDVIKIIQNVISLLSTPTLTTNINIHTVFPQHVPTIYCDENQLKQVFINILKNSIEAMPNGGQVTIKIKIEANQIHICFHDEGIGIPEDQIQNISEPFYTTKENGTGLGLMVSFKIIEAHKGHIHISSKVDKGTCVEVVLPIGS